MAVSRTFNGAQASGSVVVDGVAYEFTRGVPVEFPADAAKRLDGRWIDPKKSDKPAPTPDADPQGSEPDPQGA